MQIDIYFSYEALNAAYGLEGERALSKDRNIEQLGFIVVMRKWRYNGGGDCGPDLPIAGYELAQEVTIHDKADAFIYEHNG